MKRRVSQSLKRAPELLVGISLALVVALLVRQGLPAVITGRGNWAVPALVGVCVLAIVLLLLHRPDLQDDVRAGSSIGSDAGLRSAARVAYLAVPFVIATWLALSPFIGFDSALRIALGVPALLAPGYLLSILILPQPQGLIGRLLIGVVLSAALIPLGAQALDYLGWPFSFEVALASTVGTSLLLALVIIAWPKNRRTKLGHPGQEAGAAGAVVGRDDGTNG
jgi:hypothetical protein